MANKFGQVLKKGVFAGKPVVIRTFGLNEDPRKLMAFINSIVSEGARIGLVRKVTLKQEKEWVSEVTKSTRKGQMVQMLAESGGRIVGSGSLRKRFQASGHVGEFGISVSREFRRSGLATAIFQGLVKVGRGMGLSIVKSSYFSDNSASEAFHRKLGFKKVGVLPKGGKFGKK